MLLLMRPWLHLLADSQVSALPPGSSGLWAAGTGGEGVPACEQQRHEIKSEVGGAQPVSLRYERSLTSALVMGLADKIHLRRSAQSLEGADQVRVRE